MTTRSWRLWRDDVGRPGWTNMAFDRTLLDLTAQEGFAVLRLYRWDPFCLSFGCHEPAARRYDRARIEAAGIDTVRRPTGGRAVWHADELTYAVAAPTAWFGGLREAYHTIHSMLRDALGALGYPEASLAPAPDRTPGLADGACFARPVGGEVLLRHRKVVGSAQLRRGDTLLQHGSLLLGGDQRVVHEMAGTPDALSEEGTLGAAQGLQVDFAHAADAVAATACGVWPGDWAALVDDGIAESAKNHAARFRDPAWTWHR